MEKKAEFIRLTIEQVENGFIVQVEDEESDSRSVFGSPRQVLKYIKEKLKTDAD